MMLICQSVSHRKLIFKFQGGGFRSTDVFGHLIQAKGNIKMKRSICCVMMLCLWGLSIPVVLAENPTITEVQREFFEAKIRPVLADQCLECHNSIDKKKGGLALDWSQPLRQGGDSGKVIIPGDPDQSLLIQSIRHQAGVENMPGKAPKLVDSAIADFTSWVSMGAPDPRHTQPTATALKKEVPSWDDVRENRKKWWSFQAITNPEPPKVNNSDWRHNPVDAFVYDSLKEQQLIPGDLADPHTLLRRVSLVLTGLPPSTDDVTTFASSKDPKRYERYVDTLLASKAYAERWARHWMDWYRYSESHGSEGDPHIAFAQQYRDYLIRALQQDVPYDQMMIEHLAGDLLLTPRINEETHINESAIGPAHLRMNPFGYGVVDAYQELVTFTDNQVDVVSKATMALTVSCARCHNHKFDPVSQQDYTRFYGVMISNRPTTIVVDNQEKQRRHVEAIKQLKPQIKKAFATHWLSQIESLEERLQKVELKERDDSDALSPWLQMKEQGPEAFESYWQGLREHVGRVEAHNRKVKEKAAAYYDLRDPKVAAMFFKTGNGSHLSTQPAGSFALKGEGENVFQGVYPAGVYSHLISDKHAAVMGSPRMTVSGNNLWVRAAGQQAKRRYAVRHYPFGGLLHDDHRLSQTLPVWQSSRKMAIWQGEKIHYEFRTARDVISGPGDERSWWGVSEILMSPEAPQRRGAPLSLWVATPPVDKASLLKAYQTTIQNILNKWMDDIISDDEAEFLGQMLQGNVLNHNIKQLPENVVALVQQYRRLENDIPIPTRAPGVYESDPVDAPFLNRGDHQSEGKAVPRQFLEMFGNKPYSKTNSGRLELAQDIVADNNPLTRRVLVNRLWNYVFGAGLVATTDNFGRMGGQPSHPELLDFLASDFKRNGWSLKKSLKLMVTSRTFKLSSQITAAAREVDPVNKYLSFHTPRRLDAESIYDSLHFVAGQKKRAIYESVIRNRLHPFLTAFNYPVPLSTVSRRPSNNVPAQALSLMNGLAEDLSGNLLSRVNVKRDVDVVLRELFLRFYAREITASDRTLCQNFLGENPDAEDWRRLIATLFNSKELIYVY